MSKDNIFTLKNYEGNYDISSFGKYKFVNGVLFALDVCDWYKVRKDQFNSDREYYNLYKYAKDEKNRKSYEAI